LDSRIRTDRYKHLCDKGLKVPQNNSELHRKVHTLPKMRVITYDDEAASTLEQDQSSQAIRSEITIN
jgi:hypothetical protein